MYRRWKIALGIVLILNGFISSLFNFSLLRVLLFIFLFESLRCITVSVNIRYWTLRCSCVIVYLLGWLIGRSIYSQLGLVPIEKTGAEEKVGHSNVMSVNNMEKRCDCCYEETTVYTHTFPG